MKNVTKLSLVGGALLAGSAFAGNLAGKGTSVSYGKNTTTQVSKTYTLFKLGSPSLALGYDSKYVTRGYHLGDDWLSAGLSAPLSLFGKSLNVGAVYGGGNTAHTTGDQFEEAIYSAGFSKELGFATGSLEYLYYNYHNTAAADEQELAIGLSHLCAKSGITAGLTYFAGLSGGDTGIRGKDNEGYSELSLSKKINLLGKNLTATTTGGYLVERGQASHITTSLAYDTKLGGFNFTPYAAYTVELNGLREDKNAINKNELFGGVKATYSF